MEFEYTEITPTEKFNLVTQILRRQEVQHFLMSMEGESTVELEDEIATLRCKVEEHREAAEAEQSSITPPPNVPDDPVADVATE
jgi:hypothetical protein